MSKVLVTGGLGFIGSHIVDLLLEEGFEVVVVDNLSTGCRDNWNRGSKFYCKDICSRDLRNVFMKERPEYVIHQAAQVNVRKSVSDPLFDASVNVLGSVNVLECCRASGVKRIVYASSGGAVYGEPLYLPVDENHPVNPLCPYGASKYAVEKYLYLYRKNYGLDYVVLRYANVYGPRQDPRGEAGVVSIFISKLLSGVSPVIFGDGEQTRDFVYVGDVASANLKALDSSSECCVFNIGTGVETSVNLLFEEVRRHVGSSLEAFHGGVVLGEVRRICLDVSLAFKELGWRPTVSLDAGLKKTVDWFRENQQSI